MTQTFRTSLFVISALSLVLVAGCGSSSSPESGTITAGVHGGRGGDGGRGAAKPETEDGGATPEVEAADGGVETEDAAPEIEDAEVEAPRGDGGHHGG